MRLIDPRNERDRRMRHRPRGCRRWPAARSRSIDISKPGGSVFLDRLDTRLRDLGVAAITRAVKPAFSKLAPQALLDQVRDAEAVVLALAD